MIVSLMAMLRIGRRSIAIRALNRNGETTWIRAETTSHLVRSKTNFTNERQGFRSAKLWTAVLGALWTLRVHRVPGLEPAAWQRMLASARRGASTKQSADLRPKEPRPASDRGGRYATVTFGSLWRLKPRRCNLLLTQQCVRLGGGRTRAVLVARPHSLAWRKSAMPQKPR